MSDVTTVYALGSDCICDLDEVDGYSQVCEGDCWAWSKQDLELAFDDWLKAMDKDQLQEVLRVDAEGLGWRRLSGSTFVRCRFEELFDLFLINGDFRLEFTFDKDGSLSVQRWSHDEPMGSARFVVCVTDLDTIPEEV